MRKVTLNLKRRKWNDFQKWKELKRLGMKNVGRGLWSLWRDEPAIFLSRWPWIIIDRPRVERLVDPEHRLILSTLDFKKREKVRTTFKDPTIRLIKGKKKIWEEHFIISEKVQNLKIMYLMNFKIWKKEFEV